MSPLKPHAQSILLLEQIIEDPVTGLTLQIMRTPSGEGRIRIFGNLPFSNRVLEFNAEGRLIGTGTAVQGGPCPTWLQEVAP